MTDSNIVVSLREYVEAILVERDRALTMAGDEREKAADVLRQEQHRALTTAESEREKAASALRDTLAQAIREGDERLREHISNQVAQINATLESGELLEIERIRAVHDQLVALIEGVTREFGQAQNAAQAAVAKAEQAQQRVNEGQNEFRQTLSDQATLLMPRKESEARHDETGRQIREMRDEMSTLRTALAVGPSGLGLLEGRVDRSEGRRDGTAAIAASLIAVAGVLAVAAGVIVAIVTH